VSGEYQRLIERRDLVERDVEELSEQMAEGEVDETTGAQLMEGYQKELSAVTAALAKLPKPPKAKQGPAPKAKPRPVAKADRAAESEPVAGRSVQRVVVGSLVVITALSVAIFLAARDTTPDDPGGAAAGPGDLTVDPNAVTNEQLEAVVAENPGIPAMRLALANRYFRAGQFPEAMDHFRIIAESDPAPEDETLILARMGWIEHNIGRHEAAAALITQSLAIDPANLEAQLFQGLVTLYGLNDPAQAIPQLETALKIPGLLEANVADLHTAIAEAQARLDS
jgi:tetratricopeptide (TPR) repeat protein